MSKAIVNQNQVNTCVCVCSFCGRQGRRGGLFSFYKEFSQIMCEKILKYSTHCFSFGAMTG